MQTQKYVAELIGTFLLVFLGTASIVAFGGAFASGAPTIGYLGIALAFGLTLAVLIYTLGPISGGHFNPAVTIGLVAARRFNTKDLAPYVVVQTIGAILASAVVLAIVQGNPTLLANANATLLGANFSGAATVPMVSILIAEIVLTFVLVWTVITVSEKQFAHPAFGGLAVGLTLAVIHLAGIGISTAGVNPARSIGPAILAQGAALTQLWIFLVAPIVGGIIAAGVYSAINATPSATKSEARARA